MPTELFKEMMKFLVSQAWTDKPRILIKYSFINALERNPDYLPELERPRAHIVSDEVEKYIDKILDHLRDGKEL